MYKAFFDGGSRGNPGPASAGAVLLDDNGKILWEFSSYLGRKTNNEAEYTALLELLEELSRRGLEKVKIYGDSQLVVSQVNGIWKVRKPHLMKYYKKVESLVSQGGHIVRWIPREDNIHADRLCNEALDRKEESDGKKNSGTNRFDPKKLERVHRYIFIAHGTEDYAVDTFHKNCSCPAFRRKKNCKHLEASQELNSKTEKPMKGEGTVGD